MRFLRPHHRPRYCLSSSVSYHYALSIKFQSLSTASSSSSSSSAEPVTVSTSRKTSFLNNRFTSYSWDWHGPGWTYTQQQQQQRKSTKTIPGAEHGSKLHIAIQHAVRQHLKERNLIPIESSIKSIVEVSKTSSSIQTPKPSSQNNHNPTTIEIDLSLPFRTILTLNGFKEVPVPCSTKDVLRLAEGVVVSPSEELTSTQQVSPSQTPTRRYRRRSSSSSNDNNDDTFTVFEPVTLMFSKVTDPSTTTIKNTSQSSSSSSSPSLPLIVQEDIRIYRLLENQAAAFLDHWYETITSWYDRRIERPYHRQVKRIQNTIDDVGRTVIGTTRHYRQQLSLLLLSSSSSSSSLSPTAKNQVQSSLKSELPEIIEEHDEDDIDDIDRKSRVRTFAASSKPHLSAPEDLEDLIVFHVANVEPTQSNINTDDQLTVNPSTSLVWYRGMTQCTRIVALPKYVLSHSSASTLVSISLVVFGAIPLAYRSFKFVLDYPGWSFPVAVSVLLSISYGIWSSRSSAWTNQSFVVSNAMWHRLQGRDEAVILMLTESTIDQISQSVLREYNRYHYPKTTRIDGISHGLTPDETDLNPLRIAMELGLVCRQDEFSNEPNDEAKDDDGTTEKPKKLNQSGEASGKWKLQSIPMDAAIANLTMTR